VSLVPFVDFGTVWDNQGSVALPNTLASTGLGLRWQIGDTISLRVDYGLPFQSVAEPELGEQRWNFSLFFGTRF
jgi:hemolysin activation/secretion protein